jgi:hypothetical protein
MLMTSSNFCVEKMQRNRGYLSCMGSLRILRVYTPAEDGSRGEKGLCGFVSRIGVGRSIHKTLVELVGFIGAEAYSPAHRRLGSRAKLESRLPVRINRHMN